MLLNTNFYLDINVANDIAIDFAKCALPGKVMQGSPCPKLRFLTYEIGCYTMKLNN